MNKYHFCFRLDMERDVDIPVKREIRDAIKKKKLNLTYNEYFARIVEIN